MLVPKVIPHFFDDALPQNVAALAMDYFIPDDRELMHTWRHENQHAVASRGLFHSKPKESLFRHVHDVTLQFAAVHINPDLAGRCGFRVANRGDDPIVIQPADKFLAEHGSPTRA